MDVQTLLKSIKLLEPELRLRSEFYRYCEAFRRVHEPQRPLEDLAYQDFLAYLKRLKDGSLGLGFPSGFVPSTIYWLIREDHTILGNSSLRHWLTPTLEDIGGHIGYAIHPLERHKGYGTLLLQLTLEKAREKGISKVLITCDSDNLASSGVIIKNGGVLASQNVSIQTEKLTSRYWIDL
jgi:predicted acetyltransferase